VANCLVDESSADAKLFGQPGLDDPVSGSRASIEGIGLERIEHSFSRRQDPLYPSRDERLDSDAGSSTAESRKTNGARVSQIWHLKC